jgi:DNA polymerase III alpha subunit (gram-positive type)
LEGDPQQAASRSSGALNFMTSKREIFISVDVETAGPIPGEFSLLSIGACDVDDESRSFSIELKPINRNADPKALEVTGLSLEILAERGEEPAAAMKAFGNWAQSLAGEDAALVFVGFNAPFDWSFVNYYFHRFTGANPFGFTALDIKALYMGATGSTWSDTRSSQISKHLSPTRQGDHDALHDAKYQAELFRLVRALLEKATNQRG